MAKKKIIEKTKIGHRPALFTDPRLLQVKAEQYFKECEVKEESLTITGLCLFLGFESRQSFLDYEKREGFSCTIKSLRTKIEKAYELRLHENSCTGAIFALKNFGWVDKQEFDGTIKTETPDISKLTEAELAQYAELSRKLRE